MRLVEIFWNCIFILVMTFSTPVPFLRMNLWTQSDTFLYTIRTKNYPLKGRLSVMSFKGNTPPVAETLSNNSFVHVKSFGLLCDDIVALIYFITMLLSTRSCCGRIRGLDIRRAWCKVFILGGVAWRGPLWFLTATRTNHSHGGGDVWGLESLGQGNASLVIWAENLC